MNYHYTILFVGMCVTLATADRVVKGDVTIDVNESPENNDEFSSSYATNTAEDSAQAIRRSANAQPSISTQETSKEDDILPTIVAVVPDEKGEEEDEKDDDTSTSYAEESVDEPESNGKPEDGNQSEGESLEAGEVEEEEQAENEERTEKPEACNVKFKKVGCFKARNKAKGFQTFLHSDLEADSFAKKGKIANKDRFNERLPQMVCDCANQALDAGNAIFSLKNIAECWTGPDDTIYDQEGISTKCVTFDNQRCDPASEMCSGKKHTNFVYYVDVPEHTKSQEDIKKELAEVNQQKLANAKKAKKEMRKALKKQTKMMNKKNKKGKKKQN